jgi:hypothetical protein
VGDEHARDELSYFDLSLLERSEFAERSSVVQDELGALA